MNGDLVLQHYVAYMVRKLGAKPLKVTDKGVYLEVPTDKILNMLRKMPVFKVAPVGIGGSISEPGLITMFRVMDDYAVLEIIGIPSSPKMNVRVKIDFVDETWQMHKRSRVFVKLRRKD